MGVVQGIIWWTALEVIKGSLRTTLGVEIMALMVLLHRHTSLWTQLLTNIPGVRYGFRV